MTMELQTAVILILFTLGASFVQRVSGFGFGIFIMTVLPYLMPSYGEATTLSGILALTTSALVVSRMHRYIVWRNLLPILATFLIVSWFAVGLVSLAGDGLLKRILGGVLILAAVWFAFFDKRIHLGTSLPIQIGMGMLSGMMGGLFGMQGPPAVLYFLSAARKKEEYLALAQCYFLIGNIFMTGYRASNGFLTPTVGLAWCYGLPAVLLGSWIGDKVFRRISVGVLRQIIYIYMGLSGLLALLG